MNEIKCILYGKTRCYFIKGILIDTDWPGTFHKFLKCIKEMNVELVSIKYLLITHFHPDHMGLAQKLADLGVQIIVFDVQKEYIHFSDKIFEKNKMNFKTIDDNKVLIKSISESCTFLKSIDICGEVLSTPGHSEDSISIILDDGIAIVGDLPPLYLTDSYDDETINNSWNSILAHHIHTIYYGHDEPDTINNIKSLTDIKQN